MIIEKSVKGSMSNHSGKVPAFRRSRLAAAIGIAGVMLVAGMSGSAFAARKTCDDGSYPPCDKDGGEPVGTNNLSYPVIWSDNTTNGDFVPSDAPWTFADIIDPLTECVQQDPPVTAVADNIACYYGQKNLGIDEATGERTFEGVVKTWWLQQRQEVATPGNAWQVFNITDAAAEGGTDSLTPVVITGVDTGDLLESSITIKAKQIRTEFTLFKRVEASSLQPVTAGDEDYWQYRQAPLNCSIQDNIALPPNNCFAAHNMSGAVPGTDQSINEIQGTDYNDLAGVLLDPRDVKMVKNYFDPDAVAIEAEEPGDPRIVLVEPPVGMDATVYSDCARLIIQKINDPSADPAWSSDANGTYGGYWTGGMGDPVVDIAAWDGSYSTEINAGGSLIYGYNWNTKVLAEKGDYRLTFVLEGGYTDDQDDENDGKCTSTLNTVFDSTSKSVNVGERRPATLLSQTEMGGHHGEGGLVYIDVVVGASGGGGGGGKPGGTPGGGKP